MSERNQAKRRGNVTASGLAALLDCGSPFTTKADLYAWVVHGIDTFKGNPHAAQMGHELEGTVVRLGMEKTGIRVRRNSLTRVHPTLPLAVTCDGYVEGSNQTIPVEIKTASAYGADEWAGDNVPDHYMAQVQSQLMVAGGGYAHLWALIGGRDLHTRVVEADLDHPVWGHTVIAQRITDFYERHVLPGIPPPETPPEMLMTFTVPDGVAAPTGELLTVGDSIAGSVELAANLKAALDVDRSTLAGLMQEAGLRLVVGPDWSAEMKANAKGIMSLRFTRARV